MSVNHKVLAGLTDPFN